MDYIISRLAVTQLLQTFSFVKEAALVWIFYSVSTSSSFRLVNFVMKLDA